MSETEFPNPAIYHLDMDVEPPRKTRPAAYDYQAVNNWFKRCLDDSPPKNKVGLIEYALWFDSSRRKANE
jgi:hypothetical protein